MEAQVQQRKSNAIGGWACALVCGIAAFFAAPIPPLSYALACGAAAGAGYGTGNLVARASEAKKTQEYQVAYAAHKKREKILSDVVDGAENVMNLLK